MNTSVIRFKLQKRYLALAGEKKYASYADALADCGGTGYENDVIVRLVQQKARRERALLTAAPYPHIANPGLASLIATVNRAGAERKHLRVVDFGGADGGHYEVVRRCVDPSIHFKWVVAETPEMAAAMQEFSHSELQFVSSIKAAAGTLSGVDLVYTSSALQYTPEPYVFLEKLCSLGAEFMIFNRQSLTEGNSDVVTVQRSLLSWHGSKEAGGVNFEDREVRYPHTSMQVKKMEEIVRRSYDILYTFEDDTGFRKLKGERIVGRNYVCVRR